LDREPLFHGVNGDPVNLSGFGTATVDGVLSSAEWASAGTASFPVSLPANDSGDTTSGTLYVMNDAATLYVGLRVDRPALGGVTQLIVEFDNDHDGARADGDDILSVSVGQFSPVTFGDGHRVSCGGSPPNTADCSASDDVSHGMAGASADSGFAFLEMAHPLASGEAGQDFSVVAGEVVGFQAQIRLSSLDPSCNVGESCFADTPFPPGDASGSNFGHILIADSTGGGGDSTGTTTLALDKTAAGFGVRVVERSWWIGKTVSRLEDTISQGETHTLDYTIAIVAGAVVPAVRYGARGEICLANTGSAPTDSLILLEYVQYRLPGDSAYQFAPDQIVEGHPGHVHLDPGETGCFAYQTRFTPVPGAEYRNVAQAMIDNYEGHPGEFFGPEISVEFTLPDSVPEAEIDTAATVTDVLACPPGFTCTPSDPGPWQVAGDDTLRFSAEIRNDSAPCGQLTGVTNFAWLAVSDGIVVPPGPSVQLADSATVTVYTGDCPGGCTRPVNFWIAHAGPRTDAISPLLPIWLGAPPSDSLPPGSESRSILVSSTAQAVTLLSKAYGGVNAIPHLYAQLLAAKLNVAAGASPSAIAAAVAGADGFLATHDQGSWLTLTKPERAMVYSWVITLGQYNIGKIGPGPCDQVRATVTIGSTSLSAIGGEP
jgi:hypothetical protein